MKVALPSRPDAAMTERELMSRVFLLAIIVYGIGVATLLLGATGNFSRLVYLKVDYPGLAVCLCALVVVRILAPFYPRAVALERLPVAVVALATLVVSVAGTHLVFHGFAMSPDEWMPRLQAEIFRHGELSARLPPEWREYGRAFFHPFVYYDPLTGQVASSYRPGMAALIALFDVAGLGLYVSAFLLAGSVLLVASLARIIWPHSASAPVIAALLTATSSQALIVAMTSYAMGPHLFFNLLWLRLFLNDRPWSHVAAAAVGVFTASLHQIHPHVFFAAPFFLLLLKPFRPWLLLWYAAAYAAGHYAILGWDRMAMGESPAVAKIGYVSFGQFAAHIAKLLALPSLLDWGTILANLSRFIAWQSLALLILLLFVGRRRAWTPLPVLLAVSIVTSFLPYPFLMPDQGHGWGYRYLHGLIGSLALIGTLGWIEMERRYGERFRGLVVLAFAASVLIVFPIRAMLVERLAQQWSGATAAARAIDADVVIVDTLNIDFGHEIPRNDPYDLSRPVVLISLNLTTEQTRALCTRYRVAVFGVEQAKRLGIDTYDYRDVLEILRTNKDDALPEQRLEYLRAQNALLASPLCNRATPPVPAAPN